MENIFYHVIEHENDYYIVEAKTYVCSEVENSIAWFRTKEQAIEHIKEITHNQYKTVFLNYEETLGDFLDAMSIEWKCSDADVLWFSMRDNSMFDDRLFKLGSMYGLWVREENKNRADAILVESKKLIHLK